MAVLFGDIWLSQQHSVGHVTEEDYLDLTTCNMVLGTIWVWPASVSQSIKKFATKSIGTVHTSAKARLTSAVIWRISMSSRFNHSPYLPIVMNPENNPYGDPDRHRNLIIFFIGPLPTFLENSMQIHLEVFAQNC